MQHLSFYEVQFNAIEGMWSLLSSWLQLYLGMSPAYLAIYLVSHDLHVSIVVKRVDLPDDVLPNLKNFADADYLEIGWGDKGHLEDFCRTSHQMSDKLSKQAS